jgi:hypothetical protein
MLTPRSRYKIAFEPSTCAPRRAHLLEAAVPACRLTMTKRTHNAEVRTFGGALPGVGDHRLMTAGSGVQGVCGARGLRGGAEAAVRALRCGGLAVVDRDPLGIPAMPSPGPGRGSVAACRRAV